MKSLDQEIDRRSDVLQTNRAIAWDRLSANIRPPLLVVIMNELSVLSGMLEGSQFEKWLNSILAVAQITGVRVLMSTSTISELDMRWRNLVQLFVTGPQDGNNKDEFSTGLRTDEFSESIGIPPSKLSHNYRYSGVFTCVEPSSKRAITVRTSYIEESLFRLLDQLPDASL